MLLLTHTIPFAVTESTVIDDDDDDRDVKLQKAKKRKGKERKGAERPPFFLFFFSSPSKISHGERVRRGKEKATKREKRDRDLSISSSGLFFVFFSTS